ncbi:hypothetical protein J2X77_000628 [Sphingobacterium sp. 2149]|nr:hypothetical protein [Sphingobacterium sp. 2149]
MCNINYRSLNSLKPLLFGDGFNSLRITFKILNIISMLEKIAWDIPNTNSTLPIVD